MERLIAGAGKLGLELSPHQLQQFEVYYRELADWNERLNLTTITDYEEVQLKHFLDSLTIVLAWQPPIKGNPRVIDVGTGAGLPGLPLKIAFPGIRLVLLEATLKKAAFLEHIKQKLGLNSVEIVVARAEEAAHLAEYRERFDMVLSRAVAELPALAELCLPFCATGGLFIAQKKGDIEQELKQSAKAIGLMGGSLREVKRIELEELADDRYLVVIEKRQSTPPQYPRRPGMPAKKPLK